jgi:aspartate dehydrogenase
MSNKNIRLAIAGLGAIGLRVAQAIDRSEVAGMTLVAVSANNENAAAERVAGFSTPPDVLALHELAGHADVVVECAPAAVFREVAEPAIAKGLTFLPLSVGALLGAPELIDLAKQTGAQIIVPTGAIIGLDTVRAMAVGEIHEVTLQTRKPPNGLAGAPHLERNNIDVSGLTEPLLVFKGSAREAAEGFPANVNVAAALGLAGIGVDRTQVEVWADPGLDRNYHSVSITSDSGEATMTIRNIPSKENPKTGLIVANSVIAALHRLTAPLVAGS